MRQTKYDKLLNVSIAILIISSIMLAITAYKLFFSSDVVSTAMAVNNTNSKQYNVKRDSLRNIYTQTVNDFENKFKPQAVNNTDEKAAQNLLKITILKSEIGDLLNNYSSEADLILANQKIALLQQQVLQLTNNYGTVTNENKRLQLLLQQLLAAKNVDATINTKVINEQPKSNTLYFNNIHLFAINKNNAPVTDITDEPNKWVGTFSINNIATQTATDVCLVLIQPNGEVVKNAAWDAGVFETPEGKKVYSKKININDVKNDQQINFAISTSSFLKGTYILQIWHNGKMVAKTTQALV